MQPKKRSNLRIFLGRSYYTYKRYISWYFSKTQFAIEKDNIEKYTQLIFEHRTPLFRKLRNVDMWLQYNKVKNLKIAVERMNDIVIHPGETFS
ncbi:hypothetical protein [Geosporobacter ferrireducens]|nr:hypothetical protein [Geosporobacter ferrireducens]